MSKTRIYAVADKKQEGTRPMTFRLVRAASKSQAIRHVAADTLSASIATQDELLAAGKRDQNVEDAGEEGDE